MGMYTREGRITIERLLNQGGKLIGEKKQEKEQRKSKVTSSEERRRETYHRI